MRYTFIFLFFLTILNSCKHKEIDPYFTIAFGSCNNQVLDNVLWNEIEKNKPDIWIWGGDIIYTDTEDMSFMQENYLKQKQDSSYSNFEKNVEILATWDDHDYGLNDGGNEYSKKNEAQQLFLDFLDVNKDDKRRNQEGIYYSKDYKIDNNNTLKVILLDTRYFRTALTPDTITQKRYKPNKYGKGTMLGEKQWNWLQNQLQNSTAKFNIIISSIQFLSSEHGFESWGNMPHEVDKLENLIIKTKAKNTIILSGDRHISEISKKEIKALNYPLIDFTSSGLTHSYTSYKGEPNKYRISDVVAEKSFGILKFNFKTNTVIMEMRGEKNKVYESVIQRYN
ncbi:alkaline phosphatase family protein [Lutibacter sp. A80]|uniref:alkaline phosphatase D family protein n=1 Tax=Lutibacter sp. A80 TaxID=2918453 RepID=UPI001F05E0A4|nr:alkaline phosphatase D family protein [Lutibacter sp. A80]UMB60951.1 alkaline phosphatase family protein [Lutibacter sp. A80]